MRSDAQKTEIMATVKRTADLIESLWREAGLTDADRGIHLRLLFNHLRPTKPSGRPRDAMVTRAAILRSQGLPWKSVYRRCLADYANIPPAERRLASIRLREAVRYRAKKGARLSSPQKDHDGFFSLETTGMIPEDGAEASGPRKEKNGD